MVECFIGLGSNLGDRKKNLLKAIELLKKKCRVKKVSSFYETEPVGFEEQPWFLNAVAEIETDLGAFNLLAFLQEIEIKLGRNRAKEVRFGPRLIDLDLLFYGQEIIEESNLVVPHPLLHERGFVLVPLNEIASDFVHPKLLKSVKQLLDMLKDKKEVKKYA